MNKRWLRILVLFVATLLCCSCSRVWDPQIPYGLLIKCRDFLAFCIFLADHERPFYNHIAQRYYYAMLALASITFQWRKGGGAIFVPFSKHDDVWKVLPLDVRRTYGGPLKELRTRCDYHYEEQSQSLEAYRIELSEIINNGDNAFAQLEELTRSNYVKFFGPSVTDESIKIEDCDTLMDEIKGLNESLKSKF